MIFILLFATVKSKLPAAGYHRQLRKVTKIKGAITSDIALLKLVYLATKNIEKKD